MAPLIKAASPPGYDADFTLVDLGAKKRIENSWIASQCGWTPFDGVSCTGWPMATIVRGNVVMRDGQASATRMGQSVTFR